MPYRKLACLLPILLVLFAILNMRCDLQLYSGYRIKLNNLGLDPIHIGGNRFPQNDIQFLAFVGGEYGESVVLDMSRMDINLGELKLTEVKKAENRDRSVVITMKETVYFEFQFVSSDPSLVSVEYIKP